MKRYVITCRHPKTVGIHFFCGFYKNQPKWESSTCVEGKYRVYKNCDTVKRNIKRLKALYPDIELYLTEYGECSTGADLKIYHADGITVETRHFSNKKDAEQYCKTNGISDYEIEAVTKKI